MAPPVDRARRAAPTRSFSKRGAAGVEAALLLMVFLFICLGLMEVARAWFDYNLLTHAVREGARIAAVTQDLEAHEEIVTNRIAGILTDAALTIAESGISYAQRPLQMGTLITVKASVRFSPVLLDLLPGALARALQLRTAVTTRYEV